MFGKKSTVCFIVIMILVFPFCVNAESYINIKGTVESVNYIDDTITLKSNNGGIITLNVPVSAYLLIDKHMTTLSDFKYGLQISADYKSNKELYRIEGYSTINPGYQPGTISTAAKMRTGVIQIIDRNYITVKLPTGKSESFYIALSTLVIKDNARISIDELAVGDKVKMYFSDKDATLIEKIEVDGSNSLVNEIYYGNLQVADIFSKTITLTDAKVLRNQQWIDYSPVMRLNADNLTSMPIYMQGMTGNNLVSVYDLKYLTGAKVYAVTSNGYGNNSFVAAVLKDNSYSEYSYESRLQGKIKTILPNNFIEISPGGKNVRITDSTVILKNGRIVSNSELTVGQDVYVISSGSSSDLTANIIIDMKNGINNSNISNIGIYMGYVNSIYNNSLTFDTFYYMEANENEWVSYVEEEKSLYFGDDSYIYDSVRGKTLTSKEFFYSYPVLRKNDPLDEDTRYVYAVTNGDQILSILLEDEPVVLDKITTGITAVPATISSSAISSPVYQLDTDWWMLNLKNSSDWNGSSWKPYTADMPLIVYDSITSEGAIVIKNGQPLALPLNQASINYRILESAIKEGDRAFIIRDKNYCKVVVLNN